MALPRENVQAKRKKRKDQNQTLWHFNLRHQRVRASKGVREDTSSAVDEKTDVMEEVLRRRMWLTLLNAAEVK